MRIAIVTDAWMPQVNGVVRTMLQVVETMRSRGHIIEIISPADFKTMPLPTYSEIPLSITHAGELRRKIEAFGADAIHIVTEGPLGFAARRACRLNGWSFTSAYHTRFPEYVRARAPIPTPILHRALRRFHSASSTVLVPTQSIRDELDARGYTNLRIWTRGVDRSVFRPELRRDDFGWERPVFMNVGRVAPEKNIEAFLKLDLPGTKVVVGDGPARMRLAARYPDVVFVGQKTGDDLAAHFASADVFVFPSRTDTFGLVVLEALASGVPVAAYPVAGPRDILPVAGPRAGILDEDLRRAALAALQLRPVDPDEALREFTWEKCADIFETVLVERHSGRRFYDDDNHPTARAESP